MKVLCRQKQIFKSPSLKLIVIMTVSFFMSAEATRGICFTQEINIEKLATAIYYAEGGVKTNHPYGILIKYKYTTPKQACINTIKHALRDWNGKSDFIVFLGNRYCPIGANNDPKRLNKNWIKNVKYFYEKETR